MNPIWVDPERMSGTPCFTGTRVPIQALFDLLAHDRTVSYFLEQFPSVQREQVMAILNMSAEAVIPPSSSPIPHATAGVA